MRVGLGRIEGRVVGLNGGVYRLQAFLMRAAKHL